MKAVVVGATSSVGHGIVEALAASDAWSSITLIVRKATEDFAKIPGSGKVSLRVLPSLDDLGSLEPELTGHDAMFCSLGAYMKLDGPEAVQKVDHDYVVAAADLAEKCGMKSFTLVSTGSANSELPEDAKGFKYYLRVKGLAEKEVIKKSIDRIYIYRPGILFGRFSSQATASTRSKGNWDKFVTVFGCCCCCLVKSSGTQIRHFARVMVSRAETQEQGVKETIDNAAINTYRL